VAALIRFSKSTAPPGRENCKLKGGTKAASPFGGLAVFFRRRGAQLGSRIRQAARGLSRNFGAPKPSI
jgi:hypothetical protein